MVKGQEDFLEMGWPSLRGLTQGKSLEPTMAWAPAMGLDCGGDLDAQGVFRGTSPEKQSVVLE